MTRLVKYLIVLIPLCAAADLPSNLDLFIEGKWRLHKSRGWHEDRFGQDVDLRTHRPTVDLSGTLFAEKYGESGKRLLANYYHAGKFYIVRLPHNNVTHFYFHLAYFPPQVFGHYVAGHSLVRFELDPRQPLELVTEMPEAARLAELRALSHDEALKALPEPLGAAPDTRLLNVVISAEATASLQDPNPAYDLIRGERGAYLQVVRFESMEVRLEEMMSYVHPVSEFEFPLQSDQGERLLDFALQVSHSDGLNELYDTLGYNCTTKAFQIVESVLGPDPRINFLRTFAETRVPVIAPDLISALGGLAAHPLESVLQTPALADEYALAQSRVH